MRANLHVGVPVSGLATTETMLQRVLLEDAVGQLPVAVAALRVAAAGDGVVEVRVTVPPPVVVAEPLVPLKVYEVLLLSEVVQGLPAPVTAHAEVPLLAVVVQGLPAPAEVPLLAVAVQGFLTPIKVRAEVLLLAVAVQGPIKVRAKVPLLVVAVQGLLAPVKVHAEVPLLAGAVQGLLAPMKMHAEVPLLVPLLPMPADHQQLQRAPVRCHRLPQRSRVPSADGCLRPPHRELFLCLPCPVSKRVVLMPAFSRFSIHAMYNPRINDKVRHTQQRCPSSGTEKRKRIGMQRAQIIGGSKSPRTPEQGLVKPFSVS